jgi:hypothetical protein
MAAPGPARWRCNHKRRVRVRHDRPRDPPGGWARHSESWRHRHDATISLEGARYGIRAVAISPGSFLTPAADRDLGDNQAARDAITRKTRLKRFGQPEGVAEARGLHRF